MTDEERLRREGMADAVIRLVAAKRLLSPYVRSDDVLVALGLDRADLAAALDRLRASHGVEVPRSRWETYKRQRKPRPLSMRWTAVDELVYEAVAELGDAGPTQVETLLRSRGKRVPYSTVSQSLLKLVNLGRLVRPAHGRYRRAA